MAVEIENLVPQFESAQIDSLPVPLFERGCFPY